MTPTRLDEFPSAGGEGRYDWVQLLDGSVYELVSGADFGGKPTTFIQNARLQASKRGGRVRTRLFDKEDPQRVVIQFRNE